MTVSTLHPLSRLAKNWQDNTMSAAFEADKSRGERYALEAAGLYINYSRHWLDDDTFQALLHFAESQDLPAKIEQLCAGEVVNPTEGRPAWHTALRAQTHTPVTDVLSIMQSWVAQLHARQWQGSTGRPIENIIHVGVGGSDLGPKLLVDAFAAHPDAPTVHFVSDIDDVDWARATQHCVPDTTLVILASKSFKTPETLLNATLAKTWFESHNCEAAQHLIAITANVAGAEHWTDKKHILPIWDWVGGRYSISSAMSLVAAIHMGWSAFEDFLAGAHAMDKHFEEAPLAQNAPVILGLLTYWYRRHHDFSNELILPYTQYLRLLPAYLQQLDMESCGKLGEQKTGLALWGQTGTHGQHAFYQWLHQGSERAISDFIVLAEAPHTGTVRHEQLLAHALSHAQALMQGHHETSADKVLPGNRPSTMFLLPEATPYYLGALIALFEHKTYVQGCCWGINAFDQPGVEYGKKLAAKLLPVVRAEQTTGADSATQAILQQIKRPE